MILSPPAKNVVPFRLPDGVIKRGRLLKRLHSHVDRKLIVATAGAGYGKTTLLSQFAEEVDFPACWVGLTPWDREPVAFIESLVQSVQRHFQFFGNKTCAALNLLGQSGQDVQAFTKAFRDDLEANVHDYFILILDDFHQVDQNPWIVSFMSELFPYLPEQVHAIISSRTMPEIPSLPRLLINREAFLLPPEEIRFTADEAKDLLECHFEASWSETEAHKINEQCEGWPAALILAGHGQQGEIPTSQGSGILLEYLEEELYTRQDDTLKSFLVKTSIFPTMRAELCNSLLGIEDADTILQKLAKLNLVSVEVEADNTKPLYRYHSLFRQFLYNKLAKEMGSDIREIGVTAGLLLEKLDLWQEALDVYCHVEAYELALDMLTVVCRELALQSRWSFIIQALDMLPEETIQTSPELMIRRIEAFSRQGDPHTALKSLEMLIPGLSPDTEQYYLAWALLEKSIAVRSEGDVVKAESCCREVLDLLGRSKLTAQPLLLARAHHNLALAKAITRDFPDAIRHFNEALAGYERLEDVKMASQVQSHLGGVYTELGDLNKGVAHLNEALRGFHLIGDDWGIVMTLGILGNTYFFMAEYELAEEILTQVISRASDLQLYLDEAFALVPLADVMRLSGRHGEALKAYTRASELAKQSKEPRLLINSLEGQALIALEAGETTKARAFLERALVFAEQDGLEWQKGVLLITRAGIERRMGSLGEAKRFLEQAMLLLSDRSTPLEQCKTRLHLAYTHIALGEEQQAKEELQLISEFLAGRSDPFFLIPDLLYLHGLLDFASYMERGSDVFRMLSNKADQVRLRSMNQRDSTPSLLEAHPGKQYPSIWTQAFGTGQVWLDDKEVTSSQWRSSKAKELFFYLAYQLRRVTKEEIIDALWPDIDPEKAESAFKSNLFRARKAIYPECFSHENGYYQLTPTGKFQFDALEFKKLIEIAERLPDGAGLRSKYLEEGIALYKGPFLPECYSDWANVERDRLEFHNIQSLATLAELNANESNHERAAHLNQRILEMDPYNEHAVGQAIVHFAEAGNLTAAANCYRRYQQILEKDLGAPPSSEIQHIYESMSQRVSVS